ncbi:hypothetical protein EUX98_g9274 [Antrodiella citrinella]|uniref:Uncharacterized protein n=1 Tax=Antrodiella citrinella TaxID=2447956 RepID=A0A4S4LXJ2_9APHY|nr:hypothetical protein EUX98_g9274 [Antrodiella citrinella]
MAITKRLDALEERLLIKERENATLERKQSELIRELDRKVDILEKNASELKRETDRKVSDLKAVVKELDGYQSAIMALA